jgi:TonB family protein
VIPLMFLALAAQAGAPSTASDSGPWPEISPGRVIATPDWSDYRIYPKAARVKDQEGRVVPEILIGTDGKPQACRILLSSNFADLDAGSCRLMMQMRFEPARSPSGTPVPSHYSRPLIWLLSDPRPFASSRLRAHLTVAEGRMQSCDVVGSEGPYAVPWTATGCFVLEDRNYEFMSGLTSADVTMEVRLDAGDNAMLLGEPWPAGDPVAVQKVAFSINGKGDPIGCTPVESRGFGEPGMNNLSPCGGLLSNLWFEDPAKGVRPRHGFIETRVYVPRNDK